MRTLLLVLFLFLASCITTASSNPDLKLNDESVFYLNGDIFNEEVELIREKKDKIKYLILNSPGGDIQDAYAIALMVKYSNIITVIPKNGVCESACTIIFQAGKERYASQSSSLMYHGARFGLDVMQAYFDECLVVTYGCSLVFESMKSTIKDDTIEIFKVLESYGLSHDVFLLFIKQSVDPKWLQSGNLTGYSDLRFTAKESMKFNAVTRIVEYDIIK